MCSAYALMFLLISFTKPWFLIYMGTGHIFNQASFVLYSFSIKYLSFFLNYFITNM